MEVRATCLGSGYWRRRGADVRWSFEVSLVGVGSGGFVDDDLSRFVRFERRALHLGELPFAAVTLTRIQDIR